MYEGTDTIILYDELACEDVLPVAWEPWPATPDPAAAASSFDEANLHLLQACATLDDQRALTREKFDEGVPGSELARLDFKMNLLLDLVIQLAAREFQRPEPVTVRFNALGATFSAGDLRPSVGSCGVARIFLRNALPQPLSLPARVVAADERQIKLRFLAVSDAVADLLEKLAFRRHRRHVAGARKPR